MVFSSYLFVFVFLPLFLAGYRLVPVRARNGFILAASLLFYACGDRAGLGVLLVSVGGNYIAALRIGRSLQRGHRGRGWLATGVAFNLALLGWYKYIGFLTRNVDALSAFAGHPQALPVIDASLPLGISFFAFQGMSYLIDVARGTIAPTHSLLRFATYKTLFPQLIAGPIVRYRDVAVALRVRQVLAEDYREGSRRFMAGFAKKVLIADTLASPVDAVFALPVDQLSPGLAWFAAVGYAFQIFFDFSGYSDMAIGLARLMGFRFPENFNYPYVSQSIREFWRRWHITLSLWFRDYVYISLGGNRRGPARTYLNLIAVFALTGLWHGAAWTFVVWGLWHGTFIVLERATGFDARPIPRPLRHLYTLAVVLVGWVLFRADSFRHALALLRAMAGSGGGTHPVGEFADPAVLLAVAAAVVLSLPPHAASGVAKRARPLATALAAGAFVFACAKVLAGAYSPFLYFRF